MLATSLPSLRARRPAAPTFSRSGVAYDPYTGVAYADGQPRFPVVGGRQGVMVEEGGQNLLTANQSSVETDTTGFIAYGSTAITRDTTTAWTGSACIKAVTPGAVAVEGFFLASAVTTASQAHTASGWLKGSGTVKIHIIERDAADAFIGETTQNVTLTGEWQRVSVTRTFGASGVRGRVAIITNGTQAITFYADGFQLEQKAYPTSWTLGGTTRNAETLTIPTAGVLNLSQGAAIFELWAPASVEGTRIFFDHEDASLFNQLSLYRTSTVWAMQTKDGTGNTTTKTWASSVTEGRNVVGIAWRGSRIALWVNGVERATDANAYMPSVLQSSFSVGSRANNTLHYNQPVLAVHALCDWSDSLMATLTSGAPIPRTPYHSLYLPLDGSLATYGRGFGIQDMVALGLA